VLINVLETSAVSDVKVINMKGGYNSCLTDNKGVKKPVAQGVKTVRKYAQVMLL